MEYDAGFSGSSGNAVLINDILFDLGINWKDEHFQELAMKAKAVFISHRHSDHLNLSTYKWLSKERPNLDFFVNQDIIDFIDDRLPDKYHDIEKNLTLVEPGDEITIDNEIISVFKTTHEADLLSNGYTGLDLDTFESFIYVTDFKKWEDLPDECFDYLFIEANHDKNYSKVLEEIAELEGHDVDRWLLHSSGRHTTKQDAFRYFENHKNDPDSKFIPMHKSGRFFDITDLEEKLDELKQEQNQGA